MLYRTCKKKKKVSFNNSGKASYGFLLNIFLCIAFQIYIVENWEDLKAFNQLIFYFVLDRRNKFLWIILIEKQEAMEMWFVGGPEVAPGEKK